MEKIIVKYDNNKLNVFFSKRANSMSNLHQGPTIILNDVILYEFSV